jgi:hypothetical protein
MLSYLVRDFVVPVVVEGLLTSVIEDPFPDPPGLTVPDSPPTRPQDNSTRIAEDEDPLEELPEEEAEKQRREQAAAGGGRGGDAGDGRRPAVRQRTTT